MTVYNTYNTVFWVALLVGVVSLAIVVRESTVEGSSFRRTWSVAVGGLAAVAVGAILEYGFEVLPRFVLELVGFPILIVGMFMLGVSLRSEGGAGLGEGRAYGALRASRGDHWRSVC